MSSNLKGTNVSFFFQTMALPIIAQCSLLKLCSPNIPIQGLKNCRFLWCFSLKYCTEHYFNTQCAIVCVYMVFPVGHSKCQMEAVAQKGRFPTFPISNLIWSGRGGASFLFTTTKTLLINCSFFVLTYLFIHLFYWAPGNQ